MAHVELVPGCKHLTLAQKLEWDEHLKYAELWEIRETAREFDWPLDAFIEWSSLASTRTKL